MTNEFSSFKLHPKLTQRVADLGYSKATDVQSQVIPMMLAGRDIIAQSQTGSGKTAAFALPILHHLTEGHPQSGVQALVLTPTRELAIQVASAISEYGQDLSVSVLAVYGGQSYVTSLRQIKKGVDIIVGTPGRLQDLMRKKALDFSSLRTVILDEADEMLSMGFIEDIQNILSATPAKRQTTLFSATISKPIRRLADNYMIEAQSVTIQRKQLVVASIEQRYYLVNEKDKLAALTRLFEVEQLGPTLIFTRTRVNSSHLANALIQRGFPAEALNGDLAQDARIRVLNRFRSGQIEVLVATDVAARGLDIDNISHVFNYDLPTDLEAYVHRIGRTGRAGKDGIAISLLTPSERGRLSRIENYTKQKITPTELPSEEKIFDIREKRLTDKLKVWLDRDRGKRELEMAEQLVAEGYDPLKIASAALKMARAEENQRPIEKISPLRKSYANSKSNHRKGGPRRGPSEANHRRRNGKSESALEKGMVRLNLSHGKTQGAGPGELVGEIASRANIPGSAIGRILIKDQHSLIDISEEYASRVLGQTGSYNFRKFRNVTIKREKVKRA